MNIVFQFGTLISIILIFIACQKTNSESPSTVNADGVIGGKAIESQDRESKSVVLILNSNVSKGNQSLCTGVLISENTALTAAHCFLDFDYDKSSFHNKQNSDLGLISFSAKPSEKRKITKVIVHPKFTGEQWIQLGQHFVPRDPYDLAVLRFEGVKPADATISMMESIKIDELTNKKFKIYGYGLTTIQEDEVQKRDQLLSQGREAYAANAKLQKIEKNVSFDETWEYGFLLDQRGKDGICWGDSGGPAFVEINNKKILVGIVSHRTGRYHDLLGQSPTESVTHPCQYYAVLTRVTMFQKWIKENSDKLRKNSCLELPSFKKRISKILRESEENIKIKFMNENIYDVQTNKYKKTVHSDEFCRISSEQGVVREISPPNIKSENLKQIFGWVLKQAQLTRTVLQLPSNEVVPVRDLVFILNDYRELQITSTVWSSWQLGVNAKNQLIQLGIAPDDAWDIFDLMSIRDEDAKAKAIEFIKTEKLKFYLNQYTVNSESELMTEIYIEDFATHEMLILSKSGQ